MIDLEVLLNAYDIILGHVGTQFECMDGHQVPTDEKRNLDEKIFCPSPIWCNGVEQRYENVVDDSSVTLSSRYSSV